MGICVSYRVGNVIGWGDMYRRERYVIWRGYLGGEYDMRDSRRICLSGYLP